MTNNDRPLMATVSDHLSDQDAMFNKVRMFLQVHIFSNILCADLKEIDRNVLECKATTTNPKASKEASRWPRIPAPLKFEIITPSNLRLQGEEARKWKEDVIAHSSWSTNQTNKAVYQKERDQWTQWSPIDTELNTTIPQKPPNTETG
jgi:hypothetical protein